MSDLMRQNISNVRVRFEMILAEKTLGELVAENPSRSRLFERLGLDYCCGGRRTLGHACEDKQISLDEVVSQLKSESDISTVGGNPAELPISALADHIEETHHAYLTQELPRISGLLEKVVKAHGRTHPFLIELQQAYEPFRDELEQHMFKEEQVLFPWIRQIDSAPVAEQRPALSGPISVMEAEHESAGEALEGFRHLTNNYQAPEDACGTFRALYDALATLEKDMHQHVHLENNVLFPRALTR